MEPDLHDHGMLGWQKMVGTKAHGVGCNSKSRAAKTQEWKEDNDDVSPPNTNFKRAAQILGKHRSVGLLVCLLGLPDNDKAHVDPGLRPRFSPVDVRASRCDLGGTFYKKV